MTWRWYRGFSLVIAVSFCVASFRKLNSLTRSFEFESDAQVFSHATAVKYTSDAREAARVANTTHEALLHETIRQSITRATHVYSLSQVPQLRPFIYASNRGENVLCDWAKKQSLMTPRQYSMVNITFNCQHAFKRAYAGTGNIILALYKVRANARALGMDVAMTCSDAQAKKDQLILPWLMGWFPESTVTTTTTTECYNTSVSDLLESIQFDLRRMAIAMVGIPTDDHPSSQFAEEKLFSKTLKNSIMQITTPDPKDWPLLEKTEEMDDVAIHFRCGDLIRRDHSGFGFLKFNSYAKHISPHAGRIGIITQPFQFSRSGQARKADTQNGKGERCRLLVTQFQKYLANRFPNAQVRIHNDPDTEPMVKSYARLIMANQTFAGISSFGVFAALASFGTAYISPALSNQWLLHPAFDNNDNKIVLLNEPYISSGDLKALWNKTQDGSRVIEWFQRD